MHVILVGRRHAVRLRDSKRLCIEMRLQDPVKQEGCFDRSNQANLTISKLCSFRVLIPSRDCFEQISISPWDPLNMRMADQ